MNTATIDLITAPEWLLRLKAAIPATTDMQEDSDTEADRRVVKETLRGDRNSFAELVGKHQSAIARQMTRFSRDPQIVEELTHEVFVQAYMSLKSYRSTAPFIHWLRKIAVRVGYRFWKSQAKERESMVPLSDVVAEAEAFEQGKTGDAAKARELLGDLLHNLSPRDRLVLTLMYWDGYTMAETARLTGWSASMVKVQAHRARKRLRKLIEEE